MEKDASLWWAAPTPSVISPDTAHSTAATPCARERCNGCGDGHTRRPTLITTAAATTIQHRSTATPAADGTVGGDVKNCSAGCTPGGPIETSAAGTSAQQSTARTTS